MKKAIIINNSKVYLEIIWLITNKILNHYSNIFKAKKSQSYN